LLANDAEKVLKTIIVHKNDKALDISSPDKTEKKKIIAEMRTNSKAGYDKDDETKNMFDREKYGDPTEGNEDKVTREQLVNYLYDKELDKIKKGEAWDKKKDGGNGGDKDKMSTMKEWFGFGVIWKSTLAYIGILILVLAIAAFIFWDKVTAWWNGPAEEEGAGVEKDESEIEESK